MEYSPERRAGDVVYHVHPEISRLIVELGQDRLRSLQASGIALDARCTQIAAILFAATAFSAGLVLGEHTPPVARFLGVLACAGFVIGGANALLGMKAQATHVPGLEPSWWSRAQDHQEFDLKIAHTWLAEVTESMISVAHEVDAKRASNLNWALIHGFGGAVLISLAAMSRLI